MRIARMRPSTSGELCNLDSTMQNLLLPMYSSLAARKPYLSGRNIISEPIRDVNGPSPHGP
uniref:Uncharacterized protein n=1 Tax=Oryza meridionalis TaxID=40149 RepID=A0A0E0DI06_9ORYZ